MFDGLNLGMSINIADGASVNAQKISSSIEKLLGLSNKLATDAKKTGTGVDGLAHSMGNASTNSNRASGGIRAFSSSLQASQPRLISFRAAVIRLFPYVSVLGGIYAIQRGFTKMIDTFSEYEYAMKNMQAATGYSQQQMSMLDKQFRQMAVGGRFSAKEIAEAGYDLTTTIEIEADKVGGLTKSVLAYATATQYSVRESGLDMLSLLTKLGRPMSDSTILFDQMSMALNKTSLTAGRLSEMLKITGTEAIGMGLPFNQLLALMGRTDLYYKGGEGATRLRMMFQTLAQSGAIHGKVLAAYGLTMHDVDIKSQGLYNVLSKLRGMQYGDLSRLVGGYSAGLVMRLSNDVKFMQEMEKKLTEDAARGTTAAMYDTQIKSLDGRRKMLKNIKDEMLLTLGDIAKQPYADWLGKIGGFLTDITGKMQKNKAVLEVIFRTVFAWAESIGKVVGSGIRSLVGWTGLLSETSQEMQEKMRNNLIPFIVFVEVMSMRVWSFIKGFASGFWDGAKLVYKAVMGIVDVFNVLFGWLIPVGDGFKSIGYVLGLVVPIMWALSKVMGVITFAAGMMGTEISALTVITGLWNLITSLNPIIAIGTAILAVIAVMIKYRDVLGEVIESAWDWLLNLVDSGLMWVANRLNDLLSLIPKSIRVAIGIDDFDAVESYKKMDTWMKDGEKKANNWLIHGDVNYTGEGESAVQNRLGAQGKLMPEADGSDSGQKLTRAGMTMSGQTFDMAKNFGKSEEERKASDATVRRAIPKPSTFVQSSAKAESKAGNISLRGMQGKGVGDFHMPPKTPNMGPVVTPPKFGEAKAGSIDVSGLERMARDLQNGDADPEDLMRQAESAQRVSDRQLREIPQVRLPEIPQMPAMQSAPTTVHNEFKFGDIHIELANGDPEAIARELVPYIKKVVDQEMTR